MPTIAEMHAKAGNPDLSSWQLVDTLKLAEVAMLCAGIDPADYSWWEMPKPYQHPCAKDAAIVLRALTESVKNGSLPVTAAYVYSETSEPYPIVDDDISATTDIAPLTTISRRAMINWIEKKGLNRRISLAPVSQQIQAMAVKMEVRQIEAPKYTTPALELMDEHVVRHWVNYDQDEPDTAPDKKDTVAWLREKAKERGISQNIADAIDKVTRHPEAQAGNRAKRVTTRNQDDGA